MALRISIAGIVCDSGHGDALFHRLIDFGNDDVIQHIE